MGGEHAFRPVLPATVMWRTLHPVSPRPPIRKLAGMGDSWKQRVQSLRAPTCSAPRKVLFSGHTSNSGQTATELTTLTGHTALAWLLEDMTISFPDRHTSHLSGDTPGKRLLSSPAQYLESHVLQTNHRVRAVSPCHRAFYRLHESHRWRVPDADTISPPLPPPASKRSTDPSQTVWVGKPGPPKYPSGAPAGLARSLQSPVAWVAVLAALLSARPLMCPQ